MFSKLAVKKGQGTNNQTECYHHHHRRLRSASTNQLLVPSYRRSTIGRRAFPIVGARVWNDLPSDVTSARSLAVFGRRL